jgi:guanine nucleotide-binding protein G(i) subunit alpha
MPTDQDVLRARVRTTGITENEITIQGSKFRIVDVGGQRAERKKWINCFQDVSCILFVVAISEYDQVLFEDDVTNRVEEALKVFDEICNLKIFAKHESMLLLFNKFDLFTEKMQRVPLSKYFPEFTHGEDANEGVKYIQGLFEAKVIHSFIPSLV